MTQTFSTPSSSVLDHLNDGVIERILVLLQPASQVVGDGGGVVDDGKVSIRVCGDIVREGREHLALTWSRIGLGKVGKFSQHVVHQLLSECLVRGFGKQRFLFKDGEESHGLLEHVDTRLGSNERHDDMWRYFSQTCRSMPKSTLAQSSPSLTYSSCSRVNMCWLKNCCSFSLT